jgi:alpha/beta hydrolase family protein
VSDWHSAGGAGGITAHYDDIESLAGLYGHAARTIGHVAMQVAHIATSAVLLESAAISPGSFAGVAGILAYVDAGPTGVAATGVELETLSLRLKAGVHAYRAVDSAMAQLMTGAENTTGFMVGIALPLVAIPAGVVVLEGESALSLPGFVDDLLHGRADLSSFPSRVLTTTKRDATALLLAHPGAAQDLVGGSAGLETGLMAWVPGALRPALPFGGAPRDYQEALQSLGRLQRDGNPAVGPGGPQQAGDDKAPRTVRDLFLGVDRRQRRTDHHAVSGEIGVQRLAGADGTVRYVVQLPGTESWALTPGTIARDLATNVHTMAGGHTVYMRGIEDAMTQAHIPKGAPVMLVGHSQGGMTAAALAADPAFRAKFHVTEVVTAGAPVARFDVPSDVQVLAVENRHDLIPQLDGAVNPDRPNVTTLTFDADKGDVGLNHSLGKTYAPATADMPADDPSYAAWRNSASGFLDAHNQASTSTYAITRQAGP